MGIRAPLDQLKKAGKIAQEMLRERGILAKDSVIDKILKDEKAPTMPGIPAYLPQAWTIVASQRMMYDFLLLWKDECEQNPCFQVGGKKKGRKICEGKAENAAEFFKFVITQMRKMEADYKQEMDEMPKLVESLKEVPVLKTVFSPLRRYETMKAMQRFFVDAFAVAVMLRKNDDVSSFANWFLDWTQDLHVLWVKPEKRKDFKRV